MTSTFFPPGSWANFALNLLCFPICLPLHCLGPCARVEERVILSVRISRKERQRRRNAPRAHTHRQRRRALSVSSADPSLNIEPGNDPKSTHTHASFLALPPEVRLNIYKFFFSGIELEIIPETQKLRIRDPEARRRAAGQLALIRACRQVYRECIDLLYSTNTFVLTELETLSYLQATILPQRLAAITSLELDWDWEVLAYNHDPHRRRGIIIRGYPNGGHVDDETIADFCRIVVQEMPRLKRLEVRLWDTFYEYSLDAGWVKPLLEIRGLEEFRFSTHHYAYSSHSSVGPPRMTADLLVREVERIVMTPWEERRRQDTKR